MNTLSRLVLCALVVCVPAWALLRAQDRPTVRSTGHVLLLQNQGILEGEIERHGDQFRIRRANGEMWVGAERALWLCADWEEAFAILTRQANLHDADERLRLARWCDHNGLRAHALAEAAAAVKLRPDHIGAKQFLMRLQNSAARPVSPAPGKPAEAAEEPVKAVDLSAESLALFTSRVQPILMNACASCHATGRGGKFKLARCYDAAVNRRGLHQNLAAVLAHVDLDEPAVSRLLYKAVSAHGGAAKAPVSGRQSVPYETLLDWVEMVVANNPHLRKELGRPQKTASGAVFGTALAGPSPRPGPDSQPAPGEVRPPAAQRADPVPAPAAGMPGAAPLPTQVGPSGDAGELSGFGVGQTASPAPRPKTPQTQPRDPFDPEIFNALYGQPK